jgi:hypothetical protein
MRDHADRTYNVRIIGDADARAHARRERALERPAQVGPRGGRYVITRSGMKRYVYG